MVRKSQFSPRRTRTPRRPKWWDDFLVRTRGMTDDGMTVSFKVWEWKTLGIAIVVIILVVIIVVILVVIIVVIIVVNSD
jgi:hypothetical protein